MPVEENTRRREDDWKIRSMGLSLCNKNPSGLTRVMTSKRDNASVGSPLKGLRCAQDKNVISRFFKRREWGSMMEKCLLDLGGRLGRNGSGFFRGTSVKAIDNGEAPDRDSQVSMNRGENDVSICIEDQSVGVDTAVCLHNRQTLQSRRGAVFAEGNTNGPHSSMVMRRQHKNICTSSSMGSLLIGAMVVLLRATSVMKSLGCLDSRDSSASAKLKLEFSSFCGRFLLKLCQPLDKEWKEGIIQPIFESR
jgi:hypothetical protein